jgi:SpoVK/Ycf46/Vps4 family AAA+-type ATPase
LLKLTEGYSGADIESLVKETVEAAFISDDKAVTTQKLQNVSKRSRGTRFLADFGQLPLFNRNLAGIIMDSFLSHNIPPITLNCSRENKFAANY